MLLLRFSLQLSHATKRRSEEVVKKCLLLLLPLSDQSTVLVRFTTKSSYSRIFVLIQKQDMDGKTVT